MNLPEKVQQQNVLIKTVSLVICAKNELPNLKHHLPTWASQEGIEYEIVLVNDASTDGSQAWLNKVHSAYSNLNIIHLANHDDGKLKGKRKALQTGVQAAISEYVVLTDADCVPYSKYWLKEMVASFNASTEIVLGFSPYQKEAGFLNLLIRYETLLTALQYLSFAKLGFPYMGVGRNIAYKKSILSNEAFEKSNRTSSGDDDLMVALLANKTNVAIQLNENSFVYSKPATDFKTWFKQKQRHYSTAQYYSLPLKLVVGGFGALNLLFYIAIFILLYNEVNLLNVLSIYLLKNIVFVLLTFKSISNFKEKGIVKSILYLDFVYLVLLIMNHLKAFRLKHGWS